MKSEALESDRVESGHSCEFFRVSRINGEYLRIKSDHSRNCLLRALRAWMCSVGLLSKKQVQAVGLTPRSCHEQLVGMRKCKRIASNCWCTVSMIWRRENNVRDQSRHSKYPPMSVFGWTDFPYPQSLVRGGQNFWTGFDNSEICFTEITWN